MKCESGEPPRILAEGALRLWKEPIERVVRVAQPELDRLHRIVDHAGYVTLLCETQGVAVEHRGSAVPSPCTRRNTFARVTSV